MIDETRSQFSSGAISPARVAAVLAALAVTCSTVTALAQDADSSPALPDTRLVEPFVDSATFLIVKLDPGKLNVPDLSEAPEEMPDAAKAALAEVSRQLATGFQEIRSLADGQPLFATIGIPPSKSQPPTVFFRRRTSEANAEASLARLKEELRWVAGRQGDYLVARPREATPVALSPAAPATRQAIAEAFASVREFPLQVLVVPPEHVWRTVRELSPELPGALGGGASRILTDGVRWAGIGIDPERLKMEVHVQSADERAARDFAANLPTLLRSAYQAAKPVQEAIPPQVSAAVFASLKPEVDGDRVTVRLHGLEQTSGNLAILAAIVSSMQEESRQHEATQSFRRILIAMHNYHDVHKSFPPADRHLGKDGKHGLSWRVHLLPFLEEVELYGQFRLDEPWDSAHNKALLEKMPDAYSQRGVGLAKPEIKPGYTTFLAPEGKGTIFGGDRATTFSQIKDGTSNTIALVEVTADRAVPWTAPRDYVFDPEKPLEGILIRDGRWLAAFADGSTRFLSKDLPNQTVLRLFQMNDGKPVDIK